MYDREVEYYDAHIKAHQRYMLLQWLEEAKTAKIKKLKEEKNNLTAVHVNVPSPKITEDGIKYEQIIDAEKFNINTSLAPNVTQNKINCLPTVNMDLFKGINSKNIDVPAFSDDFKVKIDENEFNGVKSEKVNIPDKMTDVNVTVYSELLNNVKIGTVQIPTKASSLESAILINNYSFESIPNGIVDVPNTLFDFDVDIDNNKFKSIHKVDVNAQGGALSYDTELDAEKFKNVLPDIFKPNMPEIYLNFDAKDFDLLKLTKISVPEKISHIDTNIDENIFKGVNADISSIAPEKINIDTQVSLEDFKDINTVNIALPEKMKEVHLQTESKVNIDKITVPKMPKTEMEINKSDLLDNECVNIKLPKAVSKLQLNTKNDIIKNTDIPKIDLPVSLMKIKTELNTEKITDINLKNKINIPTNSAKLQIDIKTEKLNLENINLPLYASEKLHFEKTKMPETVNVPKQIIVPDNSDIMNIINEERKKLTAS